MSRKIAVIGTGYVGLVTAVGLADFGNNVIGVDLEAEKVQKLNVGIPTIYEPGINEYLERNLKNGRLKFTTEIDGVIKNSDVIFIAVGTPSGTNGEADLSQVKRVILSIAANLIDYKIIVIKSTVPIGTNRWIKDRLIEVSQKINFDVVSNPEFLREGKALYDFLHPDKVVIGCNSEKPKEIMKEIYRPLHMIETPFIWCNEETAELIKYANNAFLATKISFINQMANLAETVGADITMVSKALGKDGRIGSKFLHPGPGFGGSCFPKDTRAIVRIGEKYGVDISLIREVIHINENQKERMVQKIETKLGNLKAKDIAVLGLAFKSETDDVRESPALHIIDRLLQKGARLKVHDPKAIENARKIFGNKIKYFEDQFEAVTDVDALIIMTEWFEYRNLDLPKVKSLMNGNVLIDTRNILDSQKALALGFRYEGVGRI